MIEQIKPKKVILDGVEFHIQPFKGMQALKLERKVTILLLPIFSSIFSEGINLSNIMDLDLDFNKIGKGMQDGIGNLSDSEFEDLVLSMLRNTQTTYDKRPEFINETVFDAVFTGKLFLVYKLIFEVMKVNKFSFLELVGGGIEMGTIDGLEDTIQSKKELTKE